MNYSGRSRWFEESMFHCEAAEKLRVNGITFGKFVSLAYAYGANVEAYRTNQTSIDEFRRLVLKIVTSWSLIIDQLFSRYINKPNTSTDHIS